MAANSNDAAIITDGSISFRIRRRGGEQTVDADLWVLKMAIEACEDEAGLKPGKDGKLYATPELFIALAPKLTKYGIPDCTPSIAAQVWHAVHAAFNDLKKTTSETPSSPSGSESTPSN